MPTIDDFLVLKFDDAVISGAEATWNIQPNYYSNQRSSVCFMSVERANIIFTGVNGIHDEGDSSTMLRCNINGQNQQLSDNVGGCMLDILKTDMKAVITGNTIGTQNGAGDINTTTTHTLSQVRHVAQKYHNGNPMRLLVSARPTTIQITIQHHDFGGAIADRDETYIILRFEYDDLKDTQREYSDQFTKTFM